VLLAYLSEEEKKDLGAKRISSFYWEDHY